jgi:hypothetical protein
MPNIFGNYIVPMLYWSVRPSLIFPRLANVCIKMLNAQLN